MQRGITHYFSKKSTQEASDTMSRDSRDSPPRKRKTTGLSSDEEDSPNIHKIKSEKKNKRQRITNDSHNDKIKADRRPTTLGQADLASLFGGHRNHERKSLLGKTENQVDVDNLNPKPKEIEESPQAQPNARTPMKSPMISKAGSSHTGKAAIKNSIEYTHDSKINGTPINSPKEIQEPNNVSKNINWNSSHLEQKTDHPVKKRTRKSESESNEETAILSDEERFERKRAAAMLYQKYKNRQTVINPGSKEVPKGKPNCLAGLTFLVTGVLESIEREEANSIIKDLGGKVSTTVGKRLSYLLAGEDAGPKKLSDAEKLNIPVLNVDGFFNLIKQKSGETTNIDDREEPTSSKTSTIKITSSKSKCAQEDKEQNINKKEQKPELHIKQESQDKIIDEGNLPVVEKYKPELLAVKQESQDKIIDEGNLPWVEKYKPLSVKQIIGQQGPTSNANKLINWLKNWHSNHNGKRKLQKPSPWSKNDDGSYFKGALLSGPPGIGKTTTALLVCKELGFDIVEFNASDTRSKRLLKEEVSELLTNKTLYGYFNGSGQNVSKKHVLIMDEVDGMAGNEDRGGMQELISLIKDSYVPVICMCNDRNHQKMRSLVNYCFDLRFTRPRLEQIKGFIKSICFKEKIKISSEKIDEIIQATNNDIRQTVNHISLLSAEKDTALEVNNKKTAQKDLKIGPWEIVRKVFSVEEHRNMSLADKADLFFHDYSMAPLFVQQNYLVVSPSGPKSETLKKIALTADALSVGDMIDTLIRSNSAWVLLPVQAIFSSVLPGEYMEGHITGQINFPGWLGKYSKATKRKRIAQEIHDHTRLRTSGSRLSIRMDYGQFLLSHIVRPLKDNGLEGVGGCLKIIQEYRLLREDIDSLIELTTWPGKKNPMDAVDGRVKAALTRAYNKEVLPYSYSLVSAVKKKKTEAANIMEMDEEGAESENESEDDTLENDNLIKAKKKTLLQTSNASASTGKKKGSVPKPKAVSKTNKK